MKGDHRTRLMMIGGAAYHQLEVHTCAYPTVFGGPTAIALVHRDPDVWMLQAMAAAGHQEPARNALVLVRFCPWCGIELKAAEPPAAEQLEEDPDADMPCPRPSCKHTLREHGPKGCTKCSCGGFLLEIDE